MNGASKASLIKEALAGVPGAIGSVPDGMAVSVLVGVSPIHGLYASFAGPIAGGLTASTRLMVIAPTSAAALAAGGALTSMPAQDRLGALFLLTFLAGVFMILAGLARLGRYVRFVSRSVMLGFLSGIAVNIILSQLPDLAGVLPEGSKAYEKSVYIVTHPGNINWASVATGLAAIAIVATLRNTRLASVGALAALVVPTSAAALAGASLVLVRDVGAIPTGLPVPALPSLSAFNIDLVAAALAIAAIVLIQGAGVSESAPNPDGSRSSQNRDFIAQGCGNVAAGVFQGQPVGGSVGQTALNTAAGARDRWAAVFSGVWMLLILALFVGVVGKVAMSTLAGLLIFAAAGSLQPSELRSVFRTGPSSKISMIATFLATLTLPVPTAVGVGVVLSLLLQLNQDVMDLEVVELVVSGEGTIVERPAPHRAVSARIIVLDAHGSLLYAGSRTLQRRLPDPTGCERPVVILRLRGRTTLGATFFFVVSDYAERLRQVGGRFYLSGVSEDLLDQMRKAHVLEEVDGLEVVPSEPTIGASTRAAYERAQHWLEHDDDAPS